jgi:DNA topoisomerase-1
MAYNLVIVESPAKCSKIAGFLGAGYKVIATMGHIRALEEELDAIGLSRDFEPKYRFLTKEKARAIKEIKDAASSAKAVYLAADDDREGEAIAYSVCALLKLNPSVTPRAVFHEITKDAVCKAVAEPRLLDMNKVYAQQGRAMLDMMVGFTISPLLWKHVTSGLSAGRCQTPALRLVWEREQAIRNFKAVSSWRVAGSWSSGSGSPQFPAALLDELEDEESALNYLENHSAVDDSGTVLTAVTRPWSESPPLPLITSTLQQQASALFRSNPKNTMQSAQRLYEGGHITYMRTDSAVLSEEAVAAAKEEVKKKYGEAFVGSGTEAQKKEKKKGAGRPKKAEAAADAKPKAQEAHEAIRPTHFETIELPTTEDWNSYDRRIYKLIWLRAMQSVMAAALGEKRTVQFQLAGDEDAEFKWEATWRRTTFEGWHKADTKETVVVEDDAEGSVDDAAESSWTAAQLAPGTKLTWTALEANPYKTKSQPRFNEATLVRELESQGIGRPSTFASLIATILDKNYVEKKDIPGVTAIVKRYWLETHSWPPKSEEKQMKTGEEKGKLTPTGLGSSVIEFALKHFPDLFDYSFTASMESRLDKIAAGQEPWKLVLKDTWSSYKERYETLKVVAGGSGSSSGEANDRRRELGEGLIAIQTKKGPLLLREDPNGDKDATQFFGWPAGVSLSVLTLEDAKQFIGAKAEAEAFGYHEGAPMKKRSGPYGPYIEWKDLKIPYKVGEAITVADIVGRIEAKEKAVAGGRSVGPFEIRSGPYGLYMFKKDAVKKNFVSVPEGVDVGALTVAAATALFQAGLQSKARSKQFKNNIKQSKEI